MFRCKNYVLHFQTSSDEFSTMDEEELHKFDHDTYQTKKLKHKCQRLVSALHCKLFLWLITFHAAIFTLIYLTGSAADGEHASGCWA